MFGAAKESRAENKNNNAATMHNPFFIMCPFLPDPE
jgi:hypothetical protein